LLAQPIMATFSGNANFTNCTVHNILYAPSGIQVGSVGGTAGLITYTGSNLYYNNGSSSVQIPSGTTNVAISGSNLTLSNSTTSGVTTSTLALSPTISGLTSIGTGTLTATGAITGASGLFTGNITTSAGSLVSNTLAGYTTTQISLVSDFICGTSTTGNSYKVYFIDTSHGVGYQSPGETSLFGLNIASLKTTNSSTQNVLYVHSSNRAYIGAGTAATLNQPVDTLQLNGGLLFGTSVQTGNPVSGTIDYNGTYLRLYGNVFLPSDCSFATTSPGTSLISIGGGSASNHVVVYNQVEFQYNGGGYRHFIQSSHDVGNTAGNSLRYYLNNGSGATSSTAPAVNNILSLEMSAVAVTTYLPLISLSTLTIGSGSTSTVGTLRYNSTSLSSKIDAYDGSNWNTMVAGLSYSYQPTQYQSPLSSSSVTSGASEGYAIAISSDGTTAAIGCCNDNSYIGCVIIYTLVAGVWTQQGSKLVGTGYTGTPKQGSSVALAFDGNAVAFGGPNNNSGAGAFWIFTRSGSTWTQQSITTGTSGQQLGIAIAMPSTSTGSYLAVGSTNFFYYYTYNLGYATLYTGPSGLGGNCQVMSAALSGLWCAYALSEGSSGAGDQIDVQSQLYPGTTRQITYASMSPIPSTLGIASISVSNDARLVVFGYPTYNSNTGIVYVYAWNGTAYALVTTFSGSSANQYFGGAVKLTEYGEVLYIASINPIVTSSQGTLSIYTYNSSGSYTPLSSILASSVTGLSSSSTSAIFYSLGYSSGWLFAGAPLDQTLNGSVTPFIARSIPTISVTAPLLDFSGGLSISSLYNNTETSIPQIIAHRITRKCARVAVSSNGTTATLSFLSGQFSRNGFVATITATDVYTVGLTFTNPYVSDYIVQALGECTASTSSYYHIVIVNRTLSSLGFRLISGTSAINLNTTTITAGSFYVDLVCEGY